MKLILVCAVAAIAGAATIVPQTASAGVGVSVGIGAPTTIVSPYGPGYVAYDEQYYYDPIYIGGAWYHGPYRWRMRGGERVFFVNGRWHRNEWREGRIPESIVFRNGGYFRGGRYDGFAGAERINVRFHSRNGDMHEDRREMRSDRPDMQSDRKDLLQDRKDMHEDRRDSRHDGDRRNN